MSISLVASSIAGTHMQPADASESAFMHTRPGWALTTPVVLAVAPLVLAQATTGNAEAAAEEAQAVQELAEKLAADAEEDSEAPAEGDESNLERTSSEDQVTQPEPPAAEATAPTESIAEAAGDAAPVVEPAAEAPAPTEAASTEAAVSDAVPAVEPAAGEDAAVASEGETVAPAAADGVQPEVAAVPAAEAQSDTATEEAAAEPDATPPAETSVVSQEPAEAQPGTSVATTEAATVTKVTEDAVLQATDSGKDVVVEDQTTAEDQEQIEESRKAALEAATSLEEQEPVTVKEEVVTGEGTRTSGEEAKTTKKKKPKKKKASTTTTATTAATASTASEDDDDDNQTWKYLGAAAAGAVVGALIPTLGGKLVQDQGDRVIVEREGEFYVHKDENLLLRRPGVTVQTEEFAGGIVRDTVHRPNGSRVVTVRDAGGFVLKRTRIMPDGSEIVLIDETRYGSDVPAFVNWEQTLPPRYNAMPPERYVVNSSWADPGTVRQTLMAPPVQDVGRYFTLRDVRDNERVRALMPSIDLDTIHFALGSAAIHPSEAAALSMVGNSMARVIAENPREMFLIEGHTDAVGSNLMNLALSDRRAEAVALALTEYFEIPPENLIVQGYGERYLKVNTQAANQENRRATVRRITPLIDQAAARL